MSTSGNASRAACHWLTPNFYWLTQLSAISSPISLGQHTALTLQTFLRGSNTFALIFRTDKLKCEHPSSMPPAAAPSAGHPCTLLSVSIHSLFTRFRTCPRPVIIYTHSCCCDLAGKLPPHILGVSTLSHPFVSPNYPSPSICTGHYLIASDCLLGHTTGIV